MKLITKLTFTLNNADNLCKNEFDYYRRKQLPHLIFIENNIDAVPFNHPNIDGGEIIGKVLITMTQLMSFIFMVLLMMWVKHW